MVSQKQDVANRNNAQRSTGPRTTEGKERSRTNALKHGLRAESFDVLDGEDPEAFASLLDGLSRDYHPTTETEVRLVRRAAVLSWKLDRADRHEGAILSRRVLDAMDACDPDDEDARAEAAAVASFDPSSEGEQIRRYQSSMGRELLRVFDALNKLRREAMKREKEMEAKEGAMSRPISPEPIKPIFQEVRRESRPHQIQNFAMAPNKAISEGPLAPNKAISPFDMQPMFALDEVSPVEPTQAAAPNKPNRAERKRRQRLERQLLLARRAERSQSGR